GTAQDSRYQVRNAGSQVEDRIGFQRQTVKRFYPLWIETPDYRPRDQRVDVAVGEHDKTGSESRYHLVLEAVGKVGGIKESQRDRAQRDTGLCLFDSFARKRGSGHAGVEHRVTVGLEPGLQQPDLRRSADAVGAFDHDQPPLELREIDSGQTLSV